MQAFAQADKAAKPAKAERWTGARLAAAKKRWAANKARFSACNAELEHMKTQRPLSLHRQGDFLQACMSRKS